MAQAGFKPQAGSLSQQMAQAGVKPIQQTTLQSSIGGEIKDAFMGGVRQIGEGLKRTTSPNLVESVAGGFHALAGGINTISAPLAPIMNRTVAPLVEKGGDALSNTKPFTEYGLGSVDDTRPDLPTKIAQGIIDTTTVAGAVAGLIGAKPAVTGAKNALGKAKDTVSIPNIRAKHIDALEQTYRDLAGTTVKTRNALARGQSKTEMMNKAGTTGLPPERILAESGIIPKQNGSILETLEQADTFRHSIKPLREANRSAIKEIEYQVPKTHLSELEFKAISLAKSEKNIDSGNSAGLVREIRKSFAEYRASYGQQILLTKVDDIKSARWADKKWDASKPLKADVNYLIGKAAQKTIEDTAEKAGYADVAQLNREIGSRLDAADFLSSLHGKTVKGGRLGKYVLMTIGSTMGSSIPTKILGALGGDAVANLLISNSVAGPVKRLILKNLETKNPAAYRQALQWIEQQGIDRASRLALPPAPPLGSPNRPFIMPMRDMSSVMSVPATKNPVTVNPKTGRFQRTYSSTPKVNSAQTSAESTARQALQKSSQGLPFQNGTTPATKGKGLRKATK